MVCCLCFSPGWRRSVRLLTLLLLRRGNHPTMDASQPEDQTEKDPTWERWRAWLLECCRGRSCDELVQALVTAHHEQRTLQKEIGRLRYELRLRQRRLGERSP